MRKDERDPMHQVAAPPPGRRTVWLQRCVGIVLGGLAGAAAAFSGDFLNVVWNGGSAPPGERAAVDRGERSTPIPGTDAGESARQMAHLLLTRARELIARGELRAAERFVAAAERLEPDSPILGETRRLLDIAKSRIELAKMAPAAGPPPADHAESRD